MQQFMAKKLVLASTSPYRRELLARLGLAFEVANPRTDETPHPSEAPEETARRLSEAKARAAKLARRRATLPPLRFTKEAPSSS